MNSRERTCLDCGEVNVGGHEILALAHIACRLPLVVLGEILTSSLQVVARFR